MRSWRLSSKGNPLLNTQINDDEEQLENYNLNYNWLVVSTHFKNISQIGSFPQIGVKIKNIWNHHLVQGVPESQF